MPDWIEITDPQSEKTFYANPETGECRWTKPSDGSIKQKDPTGDWWELFDENHNLPYYYNTVTGQTEWLKPTTGNIIPLVAIQNSAIGKRVSVALRKTSTAPEDMATRETTGKSSSTRKDFSNEWQRQPEIDDRPPAMRQQPTEERRASENDRNGVTTTTRSHSKPSDASFPSTSDLASAVTDHVTSTTASSSFASSAAAASTSAGAATKASTSGAAAKSSSSLSSLASSSSATDLHPSSNTPKPADGAHKIQKKNSNTDITNDHLVTTTTAATTTPIAKRDSPPRGASGPLPLGNSQIVDSEEVHHLAKSSAVAEMARNAGVGPPIMNHEAAVKMSPVRSHDPISADSQPYLPTDDNRSSLKSLPPELQTDISQFQIDGFAKKYFSTHKQGLFRRKVPVEKLLVWSKESLRLPLIVLNKSVHKDALKCFKHVQRLMGDRARPKNWNATEDIQWILNQGILHGELRDEIYVQLCKQLTDNPNGESIFRGWELMCVITTTFPPSKNFEHYLQIFLHQHRSQLDNDVGVLAKYAASRLKRVCKTGSRGKVLTDAEIRRAREAPFRPSIFGEPLEAIMSLQRVQFPDLVLPRVVPFLAEGILALGGRTTEGIFRVPGDADEITELKVRLENGRYDLSGITDPHVPSSLFKFWLRDLADPLIPEKVYPNCVKYAEDVPRAVSIVNALPDTNRRIVHYVVNFLQLFARPEITAVTKMHVGNLAMVFAPNFLRCPSENLTLVFENTKYEQAFVKTLITELKNDDPADMRL